MTDIIRLFFFTAAKTTEAETSIMAMISAITAKIESSPVFIALCSAVLPSVTVVPTFLMYSVETVPA